MPLMIAVWYLCSGHIVNIVTQKKGNIVMEVVTCLDNDWDMLVAYKADVRNEMKTTHS